MKWARRDSPGKQPPQGHRHGRAGAAFFRGRDRPLSRAFRAPSAVDLNPDGASRRDSYINI